MAKKDADLFDRLRQVGLRKQAAKALSGVSDNAGKNAQRVARAAVAELRALADEIERRLPAATPASDASGGKSATTSRADARTRRSTRSSAAGTRKAAGTAKATRAPRGSTTRAGRGSRSRPTPPAAASAESDAPTTDAAVPPPAASTGSDAPTPDTERRRPQRLPTATHRRPTQRRRPQRLPRATHQSRIRQCHRGELKPHTSGYPGLAARATRADSRRMHGAA